MSTASRPGGSRGSVAVPSTVRTFVQVLALHAPADRLEHLRLDVFGVDEAVRADAAREAEREPAAAGAEVGDDRAVGDPSASMI